MKRRLELAWQFYRIFPNTNTLYSQLNWSQYRLLIRIDNQDRREFYIAESVKNNWSKRDERQINSRLFERLLLSNDKESVLEVALKKFSLHPSHKATARQADYYDGHGEGYFYGV